eukprot:GILI01032591.1.p1 GENE.GILI01032591.1~~GILI01032591.1.p1  ORF type:complete len:477 (-),score=44.20 GILI01032591.1:94-1485(-)
MIFDIGVPRHLEHSERNILVCATSAKQSLLATGCDNGVIHLWELVTCELVTSLVEPDEDVLPPGHVVEAIEGTARSPHRNRTGETVDRLGKSATPGDSNGVLVNPPSTTILHVTSKNRYTGTANTVSAYGPLSPSTVPKPVYVATDRSGQRAMQAAIASQASNKSHCVLSVGEASTTTRNKDKRYFHSGLAVNGLSFGGDGTVLVSCGEDGSFYIFDISAVAPRTAVANISGAKEARRQARVDNVTQVIKWRRLPGHDGAPLTRCIFSPHSLLLATCGKDNDVMLWGTLGRPVCGRLSGHVNWVSSLAFSSDSNYLVSGSHDHTISFWNCRTFQQISSARVHNAPVLCVCFTVENTVVGSGDEQGYIMLTRASDGTCLRSVRGHFDAVTGIQFAESLGCFLTVSYDSSLRVWSLRGECNEAYKAHAGRIHSLAVSLNDELIITTGSDGRAAVIPFLLKEQEEG